MVFNYFIMAHNIYTYIFLPLPPLAESKHNDLLIIPYPCPEHLCLRFLLLTSPPFWQTLAPNICQAVILLSVRSQFRCHPLRDQGSSNTQQRSCFIFFGAFIMIKNSLVEHFIFCLPTLACKFHDIRNDLCTTSMQDYDTLAEITFLQIEEDLCQMPENTLVSS